MAEDSEPTWGQNLDGSNPPGPAANPVPNQRSMPVVGGGVPPAAPPAHADYQRQAAQHFGASPVNPVPPPSSAPYPAVPPVSYPVASPSAASYPPGPPAAVRNSFIIGLMERGVQGGLLRQPWFQGVRQRNPDPFVYISFGVGVVLSIMLAFIPSSFVVTVLTTGLWAGIGYLYLALGTKLAHQFLEFGICLVGGLVMASRVLSAIVAMSLSGPRYGYGPYVEPVVVLMFVLLVNLAGVAAVVYIGIQVHRGIQRMSHP